jgi:serine O-acetyltransferase
MPIEVSRSLAEMQSELSTSPPAVVAPSALTPDKPISASVPDWTREDPDPQWRREPGKALIRSIRRYQTWKARKGPLARLMQKYYAMKWRFWSAVTSSEIDLTTRIDGGFVLPHPLGIVVHKDSKIGPNCMIFQHVTLGYGGKRPGAPVVGGHVDIGAGAVLLGGIHVGDHAKIGANAVVLIDVPPGKTAVGVPARIV